MAAQKVPYIPAYGNIGKALKKIKAAQTPPPSPLHAGLPGYEVGPQRRLG